MRSLSIAYVPVCFIELHVCHEQSPRRMADCSQFYKRGRRLCLLVQLRYPVRRRQEEQFRSNSILLILFLFLMLLVMLSYFRKSLLFLYTLAFYSQSSPGNPGPGFTWRTEATRPYSRIYYLHILSWADKDLQIPTCG